MDYGDNMNNDCLEIKNKEIMSENQTLRMKILEMENKIKDLQMQSCRKHNERNAGRKKYLDREVVRSIFRMYARGMSYRQIADKLNYDNIPTQNGKSWAKSSVGFIINNKGYVQEGFLSEKEYNLDFT